MEFGKKKMAKLKDISEITGISVAQVSRALNGHSDVSEETRERVLHAAKSLNYSPNLSARRLVTGRSNNIGFVKREHDQLAQDVTFLDNFIGLTRAFSEKDLHLSFHLVEQDKDILDVYSSLYYSGVIGGFVLTEPRRHDERITHLLAENIPFVVHGKDPDQSGYSYVDVDNFGIGYELTQYLILQGHKKIALINGVSTRDFSYSRLQGYKQALIDYNIDFDESLTIDGHMNEAFGNASALRLMRFSQTPPSAVICGNMLLAHGVYQAMNSLQMEIPRDVSIVAHDDDYAQFQGLEFQPLTTITRSAVSEAYQPLADFMARKILQNDDDIFEKIIPFEFLTRGSVRFL